MIKVCGVSLWGAWGLFVVLLAGCGRGLPDVDTAIRENVLLLGNGAEPKALDPHRVSGAGEYNIIIALLEGLTGLHPEDDNLVEPGMAERWESNEDASIWTFYLRRDALWSNGDPVTAGDFAWAYQRILQRELAAEYAQMLFILKNAEEWYDGKIEDFGEVGVEVVGPHVLRLHLVGPTPYFLKMLHHYTWFPLHRKTIEQYGGMTAMNGEWTLPGNFVGNGPFVLSEWKPNQYIKVDKNPVYWDREEVKLESIYFFPIVDLNTEQRMFNSGRLHITYEVPGNHIPSLLESGSEVLQMDEHLGTYYYSFNTTREPLDKPKVREALNLAIDRHVLVDRVAMGGQKPAYGFVPPGFEGYPAMEVVGFNPEKARRLLAEAGYPEGRGFPRLNLMFNTSEGHRKLAEAVVAMWNKELNIEVQLENKEWKVFLDTKKNLNYDIARMGWIGDYMDPITFLSLFTADNGNNNTGWGDEAYDGLIARAFRSATEEEHLSSLREAEAILMEQLPVMPVYYYSRNYLKDPRVQGWHAKRLDNRPYKYIHFVQ